MRRLVVLLSLSLAFAALLPASAWAAAPVPALRAIAASETTAPAVATTATVSSRIAPGVVDYGAKATVTARLTDASGTLLPNMTVTLQRLEASGWTTATTLSSATGAYATQVVVVERKSYRVAYLGDATHLAAVGPTMTVTSRAMLTAPTTWGRVIRGTSIPVTGIVRPRHLAGQPCVALQCDQLVRGKWRRVMTVNASVSDYCSFSKYAASVRLPYTGAWRIRAAHADTGHAATYTGYAYVNVVPEPPFRFSSGGPRFSSWFSRMKGAHRVDCSWSWSGSGRHMFTVFYSFTVNGGPEQRGKLMREMTSPGRCSATLSLPDNAKVRLEIAGNAHSWSVVVR